MFRLCANRVAAVAVVEQSRGAVVRVRLTEAATVEFARLTRALEGRMLAVVVGEEVLYRAVVRAPVESGRLASPVLSGSAAATLRREILAPQPPEECGGTQQPQARPVRGRAGE